MRRRSHTYAHRHAHQGAPGSHRYPRTDTYPGTADSDSNPRANCYPSAVYSHSYPYQAATPTTSPPTATTTPFQVTVMNFTLPNVTVPVGTTITWRNDDSVAHTVTSGKNGQFDGAGWDSPVLPTGQTFSLSLTKTGAFAYTCRIHPSLNATVTVTQSGAPSFTFPAPGSGGY